MPLNESTRHMISSEQFAHMKPGVRILNVARGGVIDEAALATAIESGHVAGAALDVFEDEPLGADSPLRNLSQVVLTPHLGGSTVEAQEKVAVDVALQVLDVLEGRPARYAVNADSAAQGARFPDPVHRPGRTHGALPAPDQQPGDRPVGGHRTWGWPITTSTTSWPQASRACWPASSKNVST
ncbi:MAG: NAD(P)-dependent oxidoreductase [Caldilineaceae bacterium]